MTGTAQPREWPGKWADEAACATTDPDMFHPEKGGTSLPAIKVCRTCPVRVECLEHALRNREYKSVWGGTTGAQRKRLNAKRRAA